MTCKKCNKPVNDLKKDGKVEVSEHVNGKDTKVEYHYYCYFTKPIQTEQ